MNKKIIIGFLVSLLYSCSTDNTHFKDASIEKTNIVEKNINIEKQKKIEKTLLKQKEIISNYDFYTDNSITKFVDNKINYKNPKYIPENLVKLEGKYILDAKGNSKVRKITLEKLKLLSKDFYNEFGEKLKVVSAYRGYVYQKGIKDRGCPDIFCAKAGFSEHQSGLAVDFWEVSEVNNYKKNEILKKYFEWMNIKGSKYGFTNSYQNGVEIDGYSIEPWHWRYVGVELATYLKKHKMTFVEYYYKNIK